MCVASQAGRKTQTRLSAVAITLDTYSYAIRAMQEEAAAKIAELVFAAG